MSVLSTLFGISAQLAKAGVPPLSPYWRGEAERFYTHPTANLLAECVGRGGDKSRTSTLMAIAEVLAGEFRIPPGERHYFTHVSENRDEAAKTLAILEQYLRILRVPFTRAGDTVELTEMPRGFKVLACRVGAVSGWRCIGWTADECAKWDDQGADPAQEIIASIRAMSVTHPTARGRMFSSPLATLGHFYEVWHAGDTADQVTGQAPSWLANPSITEEQTHKLERDPKRHAREYGAIPLEGHEESLFDPGLLDRAQRVEPGDVPPERGVSYLAAMDPSLGRNAWTFVIAGLRVVGDTIDTPRGRRKASIVLAREWRAPKGGAPLDPAAVLSTIATHCRPYGVTRVWTDQFHGESLASIADRTQLGILVMVDKPTPAQRLERYEGTLTRFLDDALELPRDPMVRADLLAVRRRVLAGNNGFTISMAVTGDGRHADYAPSIVLGLSQLPTIIAAEEAFARKIDRVEAQWARLGGSGRDAEERQQYLDAAAAREATTLSLTWQEKQRAILEREKANWDKFVARGGVERDADDLPRSPAIGRQFRRGFFG